MTHAHFNCTAATLVVTTYTKLNHVVDFDGLEQCGAMYKQVLDETGRRDKSEVCIIAKPDTSAKEHFGVENARDPFGNFDVDDKL